MGDKDKYKRVLLEFLEEDAEVVNAVKKIIASERTNFKYNENQDLGLSKQNRDLEKEMVSIIQQKKDLENKLHEQEKELQGQEDKLYEQEKELQRQEDKLRGQQEALKKMEQELRAFQEAKREKEYESQQKDEEIRRIQGEYSDCKMREKEAVEKYNDLKQKYSELDAVYNKYLELGEQIIKKMERILNHSSHITEAPEIFMAYGTQENNIVALWESIAVNFDFYDSQGKTGDLVDIFQYFLNLYKEITFKNVQIDWPDIGDSYDERKHTRTSSSSAVGKIQKVILPGFCIGKIVVKKSLVIVK